MSGFGQNVKQSRIRSAQKTGLVSSQQQQQTDSDMQHQPYMGLSRYASSGRFLAETTHYSGKKGFESGGTLAETASLPSFKTQLKNPQLVPIKNCTIAAQLAAQTQRVYIKPSKVRASSRGMLTLDTQRDLMAVREVNPNTIQQKSSQFTLQNNLHSQQNKQLKERYYLKQVDLEAKTSRDNEPISDMALTSRSPNTNFNQFKNSLQQQISFSPKSYQQQGERNQCLSTNLFRFGSDRVSSLHLIQNQADSNQQIGPQQKHAQIFKQSLRKDGQKVTVGQLQMGSNWHYDKIYHEYALQNKQPISRAGINMQATASSPEFVSTNPLLHELANIGQRGQVNLDNADQNEDPSQFEIKKDQDCHQSGSNSEKDLYSEMKNQGILTSSANRKNYKSIESPSLADKTDQEIEAEFNQISNQQQKKKIDVQSVTNPLNTYQIGTHNEHKLNANIQSDKQLKEQIVFEKNQVQQFGSNTQVRSSQVQSSLKLRAQEDNTASSNGMIQAEMGGGDFSKKKLSICSQKKPDSPMTLLIQNNRNESLAMTVAAKSSLQYSPSPMESVGLNQDRAVDKDYFMQAQVAEMQRQERQHLLDLQAGSKFGNSFGNAILSKKLQNEAIQKGIKSGKVNQNFTNSHQTTVQEYMQISGQKIQSSSFALFQKQSDKSDQISNYLASQNKKLGIYSTKQGPKSSTQFIQVKTNSFKAARNPSMDHIHVLPIDSVTESDETLTNLITKTKVSGQRSTSNSNNKMHAAPQNEINQSCPPNDLIQNDQSSNNNICLLNQDLQDVPVTPNNIITQAAADYQQHQNKTKKQSYTNQTKSTCPHKEKDEKISRNMTRANQVLPTFSKQNDHLNILASSQSHQIFIKNSENIARNNIQMLHQLNQERKTHQASHRWYPIVSKRSHISNQKQTKNTGKIMSGFGTVKGINLQMTQSNPISFSSLVSNRKKRVERNYQKVQKKQSVDLASLLRASNQAKNQERMSQKNETQSSVSQMTLQTQRNNNDDWSKMAKSRTFEVHKEWINQEKVSPLKKSIDEQIQSSPSVSLTVKNQNAIAWQNKLLQFNQTSKDTATGLTPKVDTFIEMPEEIFKPKDLIFNLKNQQNSDNFGALASKRTSSPTILRKKIDKIAKINRDSLLSKDPESGSPKITLLENEKKILNRLSDNILIETLSDKNSQNEKKYANRDVPQDKKFANFAPDQVPVSKRYLQARMIEYGSAQRSINQTNLQDTTHSCLTNYKTVDQISRKSRSQSPHLLDKLAKNYLKRNHSQKESSFVISRKPAIRTLRIGRQLHKNVVEMQPKFLNDKSLSTKQISQSPLHKEFVEIKRASIEEVFEQNVNEVTKQRQVKISKIQEDDLKKKNASPLRLKFGKTGRLTRIKPQQNLNQILYKKKNRDSVPMLILKQNTRDFVQTVQLQSALGLGMETLNSVQSTGAKIPDFQRVKSGFGKHQAQNGQVFLETSPGYTLETRICDDPPVSLNQGEQSRLQPNFEQNYEQTKPVETKSKESESTFKTKKDSMMTPGVPRHIPAAKLRALKLAKSKEDFKKDILNKEIVDLIEEAEFTNQQYGIVSTPKAEKQGALFNIMYDRKYVAQKNQIENNFVRQRNQLNEEIGRKLSQKRREVMEDYEMEKEMQKQQQNLQMRRRIREVIKEGYQTLVHKFGLKFDLVNEKSIFPHTPFQMGQAKVQCFLDHCKFNHLVKAFKMLEKDPFLVFQYDDVHQTGLIFAAKRGHYAMVKLLCKAHSRVNAQDLTGHTAIHYAVRAQNEPIVRLLLCFKASPFTKQPNGFGSAFGPSSANGQDSSSKKSGYHGSLHLIRSESGKLDLAMQEMMKRAARGLAALSVQKGGHLVKENYWRAHILFFLDHENKIQENDLKQFI